MEGLHVFLSSSFFASSQLLLATARVHVSENRRTPAVAGSVPHQCGQLPVSDPRRVRTRLDGFADS
ncbi:hypothetical protein ACFPA8_19670 [Streptomyces ovatisporus]|uniref:Secreted protein n=1 Tax=Streptomyces ovatisporus TaxID=1128682 RepID=A0ABV9ADC2_9ACTN